MRAPFSALGAPFAPRSTYTPGAIRSGSIAVAHALCAAHSDEAMKIPSLAAARAWMACQIRRLAFALALTAAAAASAQDVALKKLLMLDFELIDSMQGDVPFPEKEARLARANTQLREAFMRERFYAVADPAPAAAQIRAAQATYNRLVDCNGCELEIARAAGAERVLVGWVQRVSNLILNINLEIRDAATGKVVLAKSVDLRGNTDASWQRGIDFLVRDIRDKQQGNR